MRPVRAITAADERFRLEPFVGRMRIVKRDPVEPEPVGTLVLVAFRVTGYDPDCDGSLMARLAQIDQAGEETGWEAEAIGLYPDTELVVSLAEWQALFPPPAPADDAPEEAT